MGRETRALVGALALHGVLAALLGRVHVPRPRVPSPSRALDLELVRVARPPPAPIAIAPARPSIALRDQEAHAKLPREPTQPRAQENPPRDLPPRQAPAPPSAEAQASGAQLFPRGVLEDLAAQSVAGRIAAEREGKHATKYVHEDDRLTPGEALDNEAAEVRTRSGDVRPVWRDIERELVQTFKPPIDAVHDTPARRSDRVLDRLRSYVKQAIRVVARGEDGLRLQSVPGSHALAIGVGGYVDPSQQGFQGVPEGLNLRAMPMAQQQAVLAATGEPASFLEVEIEVTVDGAGQVTRARVVVPSGRRAFDRYALGLVEERVGHATPPSSVSRWVCAAGYAVSRPDSVGLNVDLQMLFDKNLRKLFAVQYPMKERVVSRVALKWVKERAAE